MSRVTRGELLERHNEMWDALGERDLLETRDSIREVWEDLNRLAPEIQASKTLANSVAAYAAGFAKWRQLHAEAVPLLEQIESEGAGVLNATQRHFVFACVHKMWPVDPERDQVERLRYLRTIAAAHRAWLVDPDVAEVRKQACLEAKRLHYVAGSRAEAKGIQWLDAPELRRFRKILKYGLNWTTALVNPDSLKFYEDAVAALEKYVHARMPAPV